MHNSSTISLKNIFTCAVSISAISLIFAVTAHGDIYRFVTIDGVETFTDAPVNKQARIIIKDSSKKQARDSKNAHKQKIRDISLDEVIEKTVQASISPINNGNSTTIEPRLPSVGGTITSGVGMRTDPIDGKLRHHNGIDIALQEGTPITSVAAGVVVYSGLRSGYGHTVLIGHDNGMVTLYGHNSRLMVSQGQSVNKDTIISLSGNTGRSTGPHLHFEAWQSGVNVTPAFMPGSNMQLPKILLASTRQRTYFRKEIMSDGSILFSNIPASIP